MRRVALLVVAIALTAAAGCGDGSDADDSAGVPSLAFVDVAAEVGLDFHHGAFRWGLSADPAAMMGSGACWIDADGDGWLDLFLVNSWAEAEWGRWNESGGLPTTALYRNRRGTFEDVSTESGAALPLRGAGCVAADFDGDGATDLFVTSARESVLLWNDGDGAFTDGALDAGVDVYGWHAGAAAGDLNGDGLLELFLTGYADLNVRLEGAEGGFPSSYAGRRDLLFLNEGGRQFREVGEQAGIEPDGGDYGLGAVLVDLDGDGDLDLYVANDTNPNRLYENVPSTGADPDGLGFRFQEVGGAAAVDDDNSGMGVAGGDFDGDGRVDLLVTNLDRQGNSVYANRGGLAFADAAETSGIGAAGPATGWGATWGDFDLDTDLDLLIVNGDVPIVDPAADAQPLQLFENLTAQGRPGRLRDAAAAAGLTAVGPLLGRGSAAADYDNDGDLDVVVNVVAGRAVLLENRTGGRSVGVVVEGGGPGTLVTAALTDGSLLHCRTQAGGSYLSSEDPRCLFGLGDADIERITVTWPDGTVAERSDVRAGELLEVRRP